jgi:hypothetical protein
MGKILYFPLKKNVFFSIRCLLSLKILMGISAHGLNRIGGIDRGGWCGWVRQIFYSFTLL